MFQRTHITGLVVAFAALVCFAPAQAFAQTIRMLIMQKDHDPASLKRGSRIQRGVLNAFNQALNAPSAADLQRRYGIGGIDVYDEVALTLPFDSQGRTRRSQQELLSVVRKLRNPRIDVILLYTLYARAVKEKFIEVNSLQMSMSYRVLDVRSGRFLGGDNVDIDPSGVPFPGCAGGKSPDPHCVAEFVSGQAERLVRDAGVTIATQLAAMIGKRDDRSSVGQDRRTADNRDPISGGTGRYSKDHIRRVCRAFPTEFQITFRGLAKRDVRYISEQMDAWPCRIDIGLSQSSASESSYIYKVRADEAKLKHTLEQTLEFIGIAGNIETRGRNTILVKAIPLRRN